MRRCLFAMMALLLAQACPAPRAFADDRKHDQDAARQAVATASRTVRNIRSVEVVKSTSEVENGEIVEYQVELRIGFEYEG